MRTALTFKTCPFDWRKLVFSHGWVFLAPFVWTDDGEILSRPLRLLSGVNVPVSIRATRTGARTVVRVSVQSETTLTPEDRAALRDQLVRSLRLSDDFSDFHAACRADDVLWFVAEHQCGGMLRGATAFEDVMKTVCTVNCSWGNTKLMCERLCALGDGNFPTPTQVLRHSERRLAALTSCGYRAKTFRAVAKLTEEGRLPLDEWARAGGFERTRAAVKAIWGIGPYALSHIMVLLGDYSAIPVDCEILKYLQRVHFDGKPVAAEEAVKPYESYGRFRYLAFKFGRMSRRDNYINK